VTYGGEEYDVLIQIKFDREEETVGSFSHVNFLLMGKGATTIWNVQTSCLFKSCLKAPKFDCILN